MKLLLDYSRILLPSLLVLCAILPTKVLATGQGNQKVDCLLVQGAWDTDDDYDDGSSPWRCVDDRGIDSALKNLPPGFLKNNKANFISTVSTLSISSAIKTPARPGQQNTITVNPSALVSFVARGGSGSNRRYLRRDAGNGRNLQENTVDDYTPETVQQKLVGNPSLLVVSVSFADFVPSRAPSKISDDFFGSGGSATTMSQQFTDCSGGLLNFQPAFGTDIGTGLEAGVVAITLNQTMAGQSGFTVQGYIDNYIATNHPTWPTDFEHIAYHIPPLTDTSASCAFAYIGWYKSVFQNDCVAYMTTQMHEIGHNLRMRHNQRGGDEYGDNTGYMGNPRVPNLFGATPKMCFNAMNSWHTGWYASGHETVDPSVGWSGNLVGIHDYNTNSAFSSANGDRTILKIPHPTSAALDLYIIYNRAKGITADMNLINNGNAEPDKVVVISGAITDNTFADAPFNSPITTTAAKTEFQAALEESTAAYSASGYVTGNNLIIDVCEIVKNPSGTLDYATVAVYDESNQNAAVRCPAVCPAGVEEGSICGRDGDAACCPDAGLYCETFGNKNNRACYKVAATTPTPQPVSVPTTPMPVSAPTTPVPTTPAPTSTPNSGGPSTCPAEVMNGTKLCGNEGDAACCPSEGYFCETSGRKSDRVCISAR